MRRRAVRLGDRLCDFSYANPYRGVPPAARAAIRDALDSDRLLDLQYTPYGGQTLARRATADALRESYELPFTFRDVVLTPGAMSALQLALHTSGEPGDEVVIPVPCWLDHPLYVRATGRAPVTIPLAEETFELDLDALAAALSTRTCAVLLSHPANPTGVNYPASSLTRIGEALREAEGRLGREITLIADEAHRDFTPGHYASAAAFYARTLVVYSFGKYHFMQGQRLGYVAVSPRHPSRQATSEELVRWARITGTATPTALMQRTLPRLLRLVHDHSWLASWRRRCTEALESVGYQVVDADATMFMYMRTPAGHGDFEFLEQLLDGGVLVLPAPVFHHQGYFRLSLTGSEAMIERALPVFERLRSG